ncbi:MAG: hypothetical protein IJ733_12145, partial [Lachnospiraceae bacterium]|nr:hypothetical protein [Lachnospiraceae bacterium]
EELKKKFFYVMHFIKKREKEEERYEIGSCRDSSVRQEVETQAKAIAEFRENNPDVAERVLGIDASSAEIWCRPEVFAQAFRYLKANQSEKLPKLPQLRCSYHVGEDFWTSSMD